MDYFNKIPELVFVTVLNADMCKKCLQSARKFRKKTILRRTEK